MEIEGRYVQGTHVEKLGWLFPDLSFESVEGGTQGKA